MRILIGDDFSEYRVYRKSLAGRSHIYPMFDIASSFVDEASGLWICGFNEAEELIHTQAVRLLHLPCESLGHHLNVHRHKYITPNSTPDPDLTFYSGPDALKTITGRVCYHGEFWLSARGLGGPRSQGATAMLSRMLFEMTHAKWSPDYIVGLVPKQLAVRGAHMRYGYRHCEAGRWIGPDQQVTDEDFLVWMDARDLSKKLAEEPPTLVSEARFSAVGSTLTSLRGQV